MQVTFVLFFLWTTKLKCHEINIFARTAKLKYHEMQFCRKFKMTEVFMLRKFHAIKYIIFMLQSCIAANVVATRLYGTYMPF